MLLGIEKMFWTFDPLQSRNAHLNINRLGVVIREYRIDMYGQTDSPLHRGIGTDRFVPLWQLPTDRVAGRVVGDPRHAFDPSSVDSGSVGVVLSASLREDNLPVPGRVALGLADDWLSVEIPSDVGEVMEKDPGLAQAWRASTREVLTHYMQSGYEVREFVRGRPTSMYLLTQIDEPE